MTSASERWLLTPLYLLYSYSLRWWTVISVYCYSDGVSRLGLGLETRRVSRPVFWSLGLEGLRSRLGLEGFRSRSRAHRLETLHRLFFMKFCKEFLKKWFKKMIVQNLAVQRVQWLSFLCCYVVCEMEKTVCLLPRLKFMLNSIKKCARTNDTAARNLCNERLGVLCEGLSLYCFSRSFVTKPIGLFKRGVKVSKCFFFEKQNFSQGLSKHSDKTRWWSFFCSA